MNISRNTLVLLLLAMAMSGTTAGAQEPSRGDTAASSPAAVDTLAAEAERGRSAGRALAARTRVESAWIERGTFAGLVAVPAAPAVGIATRSPAAVTIVALGPPLASLARARYSRVRLPPEEEAALAGTGAAYQAAYRSSYVRTVRSRRLRRTAIGVLRGAAAGGIAAYVVLMIGYARAS